MYLTDCFKDVVL